MKINGTFARLALVSTALACTLSFGGCAGNDAFGTSRRTPIGPAPAGVPNAGIGAPGGASEDTRSIGSVAESEGQAIDAAPAIGLGTSSSPLR